jgi:hypothetical protein
LLVRRAAALRRSDERYERVMLAAEAGFWDWDVVNDKVYVSPKLLEMTGFPPGTEFAAGLISARVRLFILVIGQSGNLRSKSSLPAVARASPGNCARSMAPKRVGMC